MIWPISLQPSVGQDRQPKDIPTEPPSSIGNIIGFAKIRQRDFLWIAELDVTGDTDDFPRVAPIACLSGCREAEEKPLRPRLAADAARIDELSGLRADD